jgi:ADP-heptose:LPS heptosyltransferase
LRENNITVSDENTHLERPAGNAEIRNSLNTGKSDFVLGIFPFGGVNPGTEMDIKRWGTGNYNELISHIQKNHPEIKILLFEGIKENENWQHENKYENVVKVKIDLDKISVCDLFISGDTGPLHIAAAFGISTLSIFGPSDPRLVAPVSSNDSNVIHKYIWTKPECSPCYTPETVLDKKNRKYWDGNNFICNTGDHRCVKDISVEYVYSNFVGILNELKNTG